MARDNHGMHLQGAYYPGDWVQGRLTIDLTRPCDCSSSQALTLQVSCSWWTHSLNDGVHHQRARVHARPAYVCRLTWPLARLQARAPPPHPKRTLAPTTAATPLRSLRGVRVHALACNSSSRWSAYATRTRGVRRTQARPCRGRRRTRAHTCALRWGVGQTRAFIHAPGNKQQRLPVSMPLPKWPASRTWIHCACHMKGSGLHSAVAAPYMLA